MNVQQKHIEKAIKKLKDNSEQGEIKTGGKNHNITYYSLNNTMACQFGQTRGSKNKNLSFHYIPGQMHLSKNEFFEFVKCNISKKQYNKKLIKEKLI